ncbi:ExeM/NucH family extracellular endonuclease [Curtobacterium sp. VKM Ac-2887]|uniref:ExeM/NucH family extracellular endonuclease n=1 Tax=Curtobacterium sp. VKM Ac-2887 TaxID=2783819 RepID=UPI00188D54D5|nr:ExeM/NucH family extracellular endonuclease [Curtobacterium sp. VKM Ac-2887]MBF4584654.1 ExeM/NucH family extracellular endonuclease [Curtobacterium sp. VKM Ac-2887]
MPNSLGRTLLCATAAATLLAAPLVTVTAATANPEGSGLVIEEAYLKAGSNGAFYNQKFIEIGNPTDAPVSLDGWSLQYRSATSSGAFSTSALEGTVPAEGTFLVSMAGNGGATPVGADLPTADDTASLNPSGTTGTLVLSDASTPVALAAGPVTTGTAGVVDLLGYGASNTFEGTVRTVEGANAVPNGLVRQGTKDTDDNGADFSVTTTLTPRNAAGETAAPTDPTEPTDPTDPTEPTDPGTPAEAVTIAQLQGATDTSPYAGKTVTTDGVVTAVYASGGFNGYTIQTPGTGGAIDFSTHTASDAVFVFSSATAGLVAEGDHVRVTGAVSEYFGLTELTVSGASSLEKLSDAVVAPQPAAVAFPSSDAQRESLESMLIAPQGSFTVADNYTTNQYGEVVLASGAGRLVQPTEVGRPGSAEATAAAASNAARKVTLDDGASTNFLTKANQGIPVSWLTQGPVTVGATATFEGPVVLDYRNSGWKFQPTAPITGATPAADLPASFSNVRQAKPQDVGGDLKLAGFNVLNYFPTTGDQLTGCSYYTDRAGDPVTVNSGCDARGAAEEEDFLRQQVKIVKAINGLGADVVSLEEIENSARFGQDRDAAVATLVDALNAATGEDTWAYAKSPATVPASEDVIRLALIYKQDRVEPVGESTILLDDAFTNARQPVADAFRPVGGTADDDFLVIANHFKSKGSGTGENADQGDGQGASNADRVRQAKALVTFSTDMQAQYGTDKVFMLGDFNAYSKEDPVVVLDDAGYTDLGPALDATEYSYVFSGLSGSLDHVFASKAALETVTGVDIWNINSVESVGLEYSRYNYNASDLYTDDVFRASDHDPILVGFDLDAAGTDPGTDPTPVPTPTPTPGDGGSTPTPTPTPTSKPTPAPTPSAPSTVPPVAPSETGLTDANRGSVSAPSSARAGETITVTVGTQYAGDVVNVWLYSTPTLLGTVTVGADGTVRVTIPSDTPAGAHRLAVTAADGSLIGWTPITITADGQLAFTGAEGLGVGALIAFLLLAAGAGVLIVRRRRTAAAAE